MSVRAASPSDGKLSAVESANGRFLQVSGLSFTWSYCNGAPTVLDVRLGNETLDRGRTVSVCVSNYMAHGGDDYELVFTAPADAATQVQAAGERAGLALARIGRIEAEPGLRLVDGAGRPLTFESRSFDHFRS